jgi:hypothetical protein
MTSTFQPCWTATLNAIFAILERWTYSDEVLPEPSRSLTSVRESMSRCRSNSTIPMYSAFRTDAGYLSSSVMVSMCRHTVRRHLQSRGLDASNFEHRGA